MGNQITEQTSIPVYLLLCLPVDLIPRLHNFLFYLTEMFSYIQCILVYLLTGIRNMKISVYSSKGSAGKTPISANIVLDKEFCLGTNEAFHVYEQFLPDNRLIALHTEQPFPDALVTENIDIVFDLAGSISKLALSITSALKMSDFVIVPIYNEYKSLVAGLNTIAQIQEYNKNIIVVATKLQKQKNDAFKDNWEESEDFKNIKEALRIKVGESIPVLPLKFSRAFDNIFEEKKSIKQLMRNNPLANFNYRVVSKQFDELYNLIGI